MQERLGARSGLALSLGASPLLVLLLSLVLVAARSVDAQSEAPALAQVTPIGQLTLEAAIGLARAQNPELMTARRRLDGSLAAIVAAGAFPNPEIGVNGARSMPPAEYGFSVGIDQQIPIHGKIAKRKNLAEMEYERDLAELNDLERRILGGVRREYRQVQALSEHVRLAQDVADLNARLVQISRSRFEKGEVSELDVRQFEVARTLRLQNVTTFVAERASAMIDLTRALNIQYRDDLDITVISDVERDSLSLDPLVRTALMRPSVVALASEALAAESQLALEKAQRWEDPVVGVFYDQEKSAFDKPVEVSDTDRFIGAAVRLPIPLFYRRQGEIGQAVARAAVADAALAAERIAIDREVRDAHQRALAASLVLNELGEGIQSAEQSERLGVDAYSRGLVGAVQLLQVQEQLLEINAARLDALGAYYRALSDIEAAIGMPIDEALRVGARESEEGKR